MSQMPSGQSGAGGVPEVVIARGTIPIAADTSQLEADKAKVAQSLDDMASGVRDKLKAAFREVFDEADQRVAALKAEMASLEIAKPKRDEGGADSQRATFTNPTTGSVVDQQLARLAEILSAIKEIKDDTGVLSDAAQNTSS